MCSLRGHAFDLGSFDSRDPPSRSCTLSTTSIGPGEPGFIRGAMVVKRKSRGEGGGSGSWCRGGERGDYLSPADDVCTMEDDQLRRDDTRSEGRKSGTSPFRRRGTSGDVLQACSTLRGHDIKKFYNVVTNELPSYRECINFSLDSMPFSTFLCRRIPVDSPQLTRNVVC